MAASNGLRLGSDGEVYETDEFIWREYSLFLLINRHCSEAFDDDEVSRHLRRVRETQPLPFDPHRGVYEDDD